MTTNHEPLVGQPPHGAPAVVDATAGRAAGGLFGAASFARGRRSLHPEGAAFDAVWTVDPPRPFGARLLDESGQHRCVLRLSRAVGLPERVPDILGLAIRVLDAEGRARQDLLFSTVAGRGAVARHVLTPARSFVGHPLSTILPYRTSRTRLLLLAEGGGAERATGSTLESTADAFEQGALVFVIEAAADGRTLAGLGHVHAERRLSPEDSEGLGFNPYVADDDLQPAGLLNALRRRAYGASQRARQARRSAHDQMPAARWSIQFDVREDAPSVFVPVDLAPGAVPGDAIEVTSTTPPARRRGRVVERVLDRERGDFLIVSVE